MTVAGESGCEFFPNLLESGLDQDHCLSGRERYVPQENHRRGFCAGFGQKAMQVAVKRKTQTVFRGGMLQNLFVWAGTETNLSGVNYIEPVRTEQDRELCWKVLIKKQPKH